MKKLFKIFSLIAVALTTLTACGGGGGSVGDNTAVPLTKYVGSYQSCNGNHTSNITKISEAASTSLTASLRFDYYENANCTGPIVGTLLFPSPLTYTYDGNSIVSTTGIQPTTVNLSVDKLLVSAPQMTLSLTGTGVKLVNGQLCAVYKSGNTCPDSLNQPAVTGYAAAIYLIGADLYLLVPSGAFYKVDTHYTKM